jgi:hypothetical protein
MTPLLVNLVNALQTIRQGEDQGEAETVSRAFERARAGRAVRDQKHPGDPSLLDVATLCRNLSRLNTLATTAAKELGDALPDLVKWEHSQRNTFAGISIYYTSLNEAFVRLHRPLSVIEPAVLDDPEAYEKLALNAATKWNLIALEPIGTASLPRS